MFNLIHLYYLNYVRYNQIRKALEYGVYSAEMRAANPWNTR